MGRLIQEAPHRHCNRRIPVSRDPAKAAQAIHRHMPPNVKSWEGQPTPASNTYSHRPMLKMVGTKYTITKVQRLKEMTILYKGSKTLGTSDRT